MTSLLDANTLVALVVTDHVHHEVVESWFRDHGGDVATSPVTQGALVRHLLRAGAGAPAAADVVGGLVGHPRHHFWPDSLRYDEVSLRGVVGHRQVTDAYLASSARSRGGELVTLDGGVASLQADVAVLLEP